MGTLVTFQPITDQRLMNSEIKVIQPSGILDSINGNRLRRDVMDAAESGAKTLLIDCQAVEFMDSSGLSALVMSLKTVREVGGKLFLCSINEQLNMLLELTGMDSVFDVFPDRDAFDQATAITQ